MEIRDVRAFCFEVWLIGGEMEVIGFLPHVPFDFFLKRFHSAPSGLEGRSVVVADEFAGNLQFFTQNAERCNSCP